MESYNDSKPRRQIHVLQSNEAYCDTAISNFIHAVDNTLNLDVCPLFKEAIASACLTRNQYKAPKRTIVGGPLLKDNFGHVRGNNDTQFHKDSSMHGIT